MYSVHHHNDTYTARMCNIYGIEGTILAQPHHSSACAACTWAMALYVYTLSFIQMAPAAILQLNIYFSDGRPPAAAARNLLLAAFCIGLTHSTEQVNEVVAFYTTACSCALTSISESLESRLLPPVSHAKSAICTSENSTSYSCAHMVGSTQPDQLMWSVARSPLPPGEYGLCLAYSYHDRTSGLTDHACHIVQGYITVPCMVA